MKIEVEAVSPVEKKVTVEVDPEQVGREIDRAYASFGRRVKLRGFRPGKVPRNVMERHFREEVEREVVEALVSAGFRDAVKENELLVVAPPRVDTGPGVQAAQPFRFTATVEVKPRLEPKDYRGLEVTRRPPEVTQELVSAELAKMQEQLAQLVPVEGRFDAQEGDFAVVDHTGTVNGLPFEGGDAQGITVRVAQGEFTEGFLPRLAAVKLGDSVELDHTFSATFRVEALRGQVAHLRVTLQALKTRQVPALDDELAKDAGLEGVGTLEELREHIRKDLGLREERRAEAELRDAVVKAALAKNDFEVPPALVERSIDAMVQGAAQRFARQGVDMRSMGLDLARVRADLREVALLQVKGALFLEAVADAEKLEVTDEDFQAAVAKTASESPPPAGQGAARVARRRAAAGATKQAQGGQSARLPDRRGQDLLSRPGLRSGAPAREPPRRQPRATRARREE